MIYSVSMDGILITREVLEDFWDDTNTRPAKTEKRTYADYVIGSRPIDNIEVESQMARDFAKYLHG